jgi:hypothetical protein
MTCNLSLASGGSPGALTVMTGSLAEGWKISLRPRATPVAIAPMAERRLQASKRRGGSGVRPSSVGSSCLSEGSMPLCSQSRRRFDGHPSALAWGGTPEMPAGAEVALVRVEGDARFETADVGCSKCLMLGREDGFRPAVSPPMGPDGEWSSCLAVATGATPWVVPSAHCPILPGFAWGRAHLTPAVVDGEVRRR